MTGDVLKVMVQAEFPCRSCGKPAICFTVARVFGGMIADRAEEPELLPMCAACQEAENERVKAENRCTAAMRRWVNKMQERAS